MRKKFPDAAAVKGLRVHVNPASIDHRRILWDKFLQGWPESHARHPGRLRCLLKRGVPAEKRKDVWKALLACDQIRTTSSFSYQECVRAVRLQLVELNISEYSLSIHNNELWDANEESEQLDGEKHKPTNMRCLVALKTLRQIIVDVDRTFPTHRKFMGNSTAAKEGRASLFRLLSVYSVYNSEVGYCQGMSYIAGMLLMEMKSEEESFWSMVALFEKPKYLSGYFDATLQRIQSHAAIFDKLLQQRYPRLAKHFISLDVDPLMFVTPWFMCLFTSMPCWETVLAIWDLLLLDGISTIFRVALSILHLDQARCLGTSEMGQILPKLLHPSPELLECETFMPVVWKISVEKWEIESLHAVVTEEKEQPGSKRSRRSLERTENRIVKKFKNANENSSSLLQRMRNIFNPLGQRILQDASNVTSWTGQQEPSSSVNHVRYQTYRGRWAQGPGSARVIRNPSTRNVPIRHSPRVTIVTQAVQPKAKRMEKISVSQKNTNPGKRGRVQHVKVPSPTRPKRSGHSPREMKVVTRSARAQHSFKTFHTPTPLRKSQVKGHCIVSPDSSSPEELQLLKEAVVKDLSDM
ncbi:TBC1 domain family member 10A [Holothuria leucospilota]|uniref:TBC1 domain family member 10A n=1 Tax=Holothuria leucospilota TaxID=206669 RepID=A0A9Q0YKC8_HOLLE|nr:TBC1 domain family member 10A [Holothuria leucospilota]